MTNNKSEYSIGSTTSVTIDGKDMTKLFEPHAATLETLGDGTQVVHVLNPDGSIAITKTINPDGSEQDTFHKSLEMYFKSVVTEE